MEQLQVEGERSDGCDIMSAMRPVKACLLCWIGAKKHENTPIEMFHNHQNEEQARTWVPRVAAGWVACLFDSPTLSLAMMVPIPGRGVFLKMPVSVST